MIFNCLSSSLFNFGVAFSKFTFTGVNIMKITSFFNETGFNTENHYVLQIDPEEVTRGCSVKKTEKFRKII